MADAPTPLLPDYGGACITKVVPALLSRHGPGPRPVWLPEAVDGAEQVVLLVVDGLGWEQLHERAALAPTLVAMAGGPITTVCPTTTATALTSLTTGRPPADHGVVGYRMHVVGDGVGDGVGEAVADDSRSGATVLNVLRWTTPAGDAREQVRPEELQSVEPFLGAKPPVVTRSEFAESGFTRAHLAGSELYGWRYPSTLVAHVARLAAGGRPFVYVYYPGLDTVAHEFGFGAMYDGELAAVDRLVGDLLGALPRRTALVVVADHGQVQVGERLIPIDAEVMACARLLSGEGRFRWLHAGPGRDTASRLMELARERHGDTAWVVGRDEVIARGWLGGLPSPAVAARLGDVALVAHAPVAFLDPADSGSYALQCRHGSLTPAEVLVPLLGARA